MSHRRSWIAVTAVAALLASAGHATAPETDPFAILEGRSEGQPVRVPPRALAVIPERHTARLIRVVDVLVAIDPQFDDLATGAGLDGRRAIQLRTREARVPIFVEKNDGTISTLLSMPIGTPVEVEGVLVARGSRYLFLAARVRPSSRGQGGR